MTISNSRSNGLSDEQVMFNYFRADVKVIYRLMEDALDASDDVKADRLEEAADYLRHTLRMNQHRKLESNEAFELKRIIHG